MPNATKTKPEPSNTQAALKVSLNQLIDDFIIQLRKLVPRVPTSQPITVKSMADMSPEEKVQLDLVVHPGSQRRAMAKRLNMEPVDLSTLLQSMAKQGLIARVGNRRASRWYLMSTLKELQNRSGTTS